jgi:hypothetical protein
LDTLSAKADIEVFGSADMATNDKRLNDFLHMARECGFLMPLLDRLNVASR